MKNKWSNYALKDGKIRESYLRERIGRDKKRKATEASSSNSPEQSREKQEEIKFTSTKELDSMAKAKLGSGARFKAVEKKAAASGAENPAAVAAAAGIKKYGAAKMGKMAKAGKKK